MKIEVESLNDTEIAQDRAIELALQSVEKLRNIYTDVIAGKKFTFSAETLTASEHALSTLAQVDDTIRKDYLKATGRKINLEKS